MKIKFNEVTWYSKLAAIIFFAIVFPALSFYIGKEYGRAEVLSNGYVIEGMPAVDIHTR
jgi:hypothetical protein